MVGWRPIENSGENEFDVEKLNNVNNNGDSKASQFKHPLQALDATEKESGKLEGLEEAYNDLVEKLTDKRVAANRPEKLIDMTFAEVR